MKDGSALAFFQFADPADADEFSPPIPESPFHHIALQVDVDAQADAIAGAETRRRRVRVGSVGRRLDEKRGARVVDAEARASAGRLVPSAARHWGAIFREWSRRAAILRE